MTIKWKKFDEKTVTDVHGDKAPSTLQEFRRMKRSNGAAYKKLLRDFRTAVQVSHGSGAEREREMTIRIVRTD